MAEFLARDKEREMRIGLKASLRERGEVWRGVIPIPQ
jgi:hypothetical protein